MQCWLPAFATLLLVACSRFESQAPGTPARAGFATVLAEPAIATADVSESTLSPQLDPSTDRKIAYVASVNIVVERFDQVPDRVAETTQRHGGYIAQTELGQLRGERRNGSWVLRIPAARYREFLSDLGQLGTVDAITEKADEVTAESADLAARVASHRKLEEQILLLLSKQNDKVENVLAVERELARVRLEVERLEGQQRILADRVAMSTITVTIVEQRNFQAAAPTRLKDRVQIAWSNGLDRAKRLGEDVAVWCAGEALILPVILVGVWLAWRILRRMLRSLIPVRTS